MIRVEQLEDEDLLSVREDSAEIIKIIDSIAQICVKEKEDYHLQIVSPIVGTVLFLSRFLSTSEAIKYNNLFSFKDEDGEYLQFETKEDCIRSFMLYITENSDRIQRAIQPRKFLEILQEDIGLVKDNENFIENVLMYIYFYGILSVDNLYTVGLYIVEVEDETLEYLSDTIGVSTDYIKLVNNLSKDTEELERGTVISVPKIVSINREQ